jgi:hypothetical protein
VSLSHDRTSGLDCRLSLSGVSGACEYPKTDRDPKTARDAENGVQRDSGAARGGVQLNSFAHVAFEASLISDDTTKSDRIDIAKFDKINATTVTEPRARRDTLETRPATTVYSSRVVSTDETRETREYHKGGNF